MSLLGPRAIAPSPAMEGAHQLRCPEVLNLSSLSGNAAAVLCQDETRRTGRSRLARAARRTLAERPTNKVLLSFMPLTLQSAGVGGEGRQQRQQGVL